jgi:hypothetical protein
VFRFTPSIRRVLVLASSAVGLMVATTTAAAQQFVVDDAGITEPGACQLEAWISPSAGWILPACAPVARTEITLGVGVADEDHGDHAHREIEYVAQAKIQVLPDDPGRMGAALVVGAGFGPFAQATGERIEGFYAYVPLTYTLPSERAQLHLNAGWTYDRLDETHRALYAARADLWLTGLVATIGEVFGEGEDVGFQVGARLAILPEHFHVDLSYGGALRGGTPAIRFAAGVAWTPPPFFTPLR